jgi:hypothetical protein
VLVENKELVYYDVRYNLHSVINVPFHNYTFNPTSCSPVVKNVTPKEASGVIRFLTVKKNREDRGEGNFGSKKNESVVKVDHRRKKGR